MEKSRKIVKFFQSVPKLDSAGGSDLLNSKSVKIRNCKVILRDVKEDIRNGLLVDVNADKLKISEIKGGKSESKRITDFIDKKVTASGKKALICDKMYRNAYRHLKLIHHDQLQKM